MQLEYPRHITEIKEIKTIFAMSEKVESELENSVSELEDNIHIETARESGIQRREEILGIQSLDTDSLEDRRFRVSGNWYGFYPYTLFSLMQRLDRLLGKGSYTLAMDNDKKEMVIFLELWRRSMQITVQKMLEEILPMDIIYSVNIRYNQYYKLKNFNHAQMKQYTHYELRNKDFTEGEQ